MENALTVVMQFLRVETLYELAWVGIGFFAQFLFMMRFIVQWIASEKAKQSIIPLAFWYFSMGGGVLLFAYAVHRQDPVFMFGQALGLIIYIRNLFLIRKHKA